MGLSIILVTTKEKAIQGEDRCFRSDISWLLLTEERHDEVVNVSLLPMGLRFDSSFQVASGMSGEKGNVILTEWYRMKRKLRTNPLGRWSEDEGLVIDAPKIWDRRGNLEGAEIIIGVIPGAYAIPVGINRYSGVYPETIMAMGQLMNSSARWAIPPDFKYVGIAEDGKIEGLAGMLYRKEVDVAVNLAWDAEYVKYMKNSIISLELKDTLLMKNPYLHGTETKINLAFLISVLTPEAWVGVLLALSTLMFCHFILLSIKGN